MIDFAVTKWAVFGCSFETLTILVMLCGKDSGEGETQQEDCQSGRARSFAVSHRMHSGLHGLAQEHEQDSRGTIS